VVEVKDGLLTPEILNSFGRLSDLQVSPDGKKLLYGVSYVSIPENKSNRELFTMMIDGKEKVQITKTPNSENNARWMKDGKRIAYLSSKSGSTQLWIMNADGSNAQQVTAEEGGLEGFSFSPDETKVLMIKTVKYGERTSDIYPDLPKATGRVVKDLMYKHWDEWVETVPHPFVGKFDGKSVTEVYDILQDEPYECPTKPHGGIEQLSWSPDGSKIAYSCRKKTGMEYSLSTNTDIYLYDLNSKETVNLTEGMMGYDTTPQFSPDGSQLAFLSMERDGYESDKNRLFVLDLTSKAKHYLTESFDYNADSYIWDKAGKDIVMVSCKHAVTHLWNVNVATKEIKQITTGVYDYQQVAQTADGLAAVRHSMSKPNEVFAVNTATGEATELSFENEALLKQLKMGKVEERWIETTDKKQMLTWVVYPPDFDSTKVYPALLYCQGGPQSTVSQFFSYRWNLQLMAANGYIVVAPNRRGLPGFGQEWLEQISKDYGGQNMKDYLSAIDALAKEPFVDENRLGAVGASYGGFSVYWLAGHHNKRFKAFLAHAGIFNLEQQFLETEEMWFAYWDMGGAYWDKNNATAMRTFENSPHRFVDKWDTPILIAHGELDFRILASQGMSAFNAAKLRGIPTEMVIFPDENHWIVQPQNSILWQRRFFNWLDRWLK
ncbi:MAG: alpha/beta fold hydrolase, partial [Bacteroidales bacterium]